MRVPSFLPAVAAAIALLAGLTGAAGLWLDITVLETLFPRLPPVKPGGAALLILLAAALLLTSPGGGLFRTAVARILGAAACGFGIVMLLGIPRLGSLWPPPAATGLSGAMLAFALLLLQAANPRAMTIGVLALLGGLLPLQRLIGFAVESGASASVGPFSSMSLHVALGFFALAFLGILPHPVLPFARQLTSDSAQGRMLHRGLPWATLLPVLGCIVAGYGIGSDLYDARLALSLLAAVLSVTMIFFLWEISGQLQRREDAMQRVSAELSRAQSIARVGSWSIYLPAKRLTWSDETYRMFCVPKSTPLTLETFAAIVHPDDREEVRSAWNAALRGMPYDIEHRIVVAGTVRWVHERADVEFGPDGEALLGIGTVRDVTDMRSAEAARREAELSLLRAQSMAHLGSWVADVARRTCTFSEETARIFAMPNQVTAWKDIFARFHADDLDRVLAEWEAALAGAPFDTVHRIVADGLLKWLHVRAEVYFNEAGEPVSASGMVRDITAEREAQLELERYRLYLEQLVKERTAILETAQDRLRLLSRAVENAPSIVIITNFLGQIEYVNPKFCELTGFTPDEVLGKTPRVLKSGVHPEALYRELWRTILAGDVWRGELCDRRKDGDLIWLQESISPIRDDRGVITHFVATNEDITAIKRQQEELLQARDAAEAATRAKSEFLANMSHEIRTPLNAVLGLAQSGQRFGGGRRTQEYFSHILDAGKILLAVVNDILDFSKIEAGKLSIEHVVFNLGDALDRAVEVDAPRAYAQGLAFDLDEADDLPVQVLGDPTRVVQVLVNLLGNAVKFTSGGRVLLTVRRAENDFVVFRVEDTGIGMTEAEMARLFRPFEQADNSTTRHYGGTGLGLAICKHLVDAMGGSIRAESRLGYGSIFEVRLPLEETGNRHSPPVLRCRRVATAGLAEKDVDVVHAALQERWGPVQSLPVLTALDPDAADLAILADGAFADPAVVAAALKATGFGQRVAVLALPGASVALPEELQNRLAILERPLSARRVCRACCASCLPQAQQRSHHAMAEPGRLTGLQVLAAEDSEVNRYVLEELLSREGAVLTCAADGGTALERLRESGAEAFDILLTDVQMPGMNGYELTGEAHAIAPNLPVVGLTAHAMPEELERCLAAGMLDRVTKPIDLDLLVETILRYAARAPQAPPSVAALRRIPSVSSATAAESGADLETTHGDGIVDYPALFQRLGNRPALIADLTQIVRTTCADAPERLRDAAMRRAFSDIAALAHSLKSTTGNLCAQRAFRLAGDTESLARAANPDTFAAAEKLAGAMQELLDVLAKRRADGVG
ncbi:MAG TPA: PAS domain-containing protein [Methylococcaceae bacterium]|nr:PAS domain-containing protein [Methylococcaceae bacterium]